MIIDCDTCTAKPTACGDCVVTVLLGVQPRTWNLDDQEAGALEALADVGLVPPLRHERPA
jgi:hypothetical protein